MIPRIDRIECIPGRSLLHNPWTGLPPHLAALPAVVPLPPPVPPGGPGRVPVRGLGGDHGPRGVH